MIQQTLAEELHFIHAHIEAIDTRLDGFNEEFKAQALAMAAVLTDMRRMAEFLSRIADVIEQADADNDND